MKEKTNEIEKTLLSHAKDIGIVIISFLILLIFHFLQPLRNLEGPGQTMIGILLMATILWITEPIPLPATGLLIMILQPVFGIIPANDVFSSFGNQAVFFLIGAFIIAAAIEKHGLHRRIALNFLRFFENSPRIFTFGIMISCALLSFIMPEHGVAALFLPIVVSILIAMKIVPKQSNFGKISMLSIAYGCSIGSLGTLVGGARNPLTVGILSSEIGYNISFFEWMKYSVPVVFICIPLVWLILQFSFPIEIKDITTAKKEIYKQVKKSGKIKTSEITVLTIMVLTVILWALFSNNSNFGLAVVAVLGCSLLFITKTIGWKDVEKRVPWGIILLYGGAITLGIGIQTTGAGSWIAGQLFKAVGTNPFLVILVMILFTMLLTNIMSNAAAVAILLPLGLSIATKIPEISPLLAAMLVALSAGLAFVLVIATPGNAITYSSGYFSTKDLFRAGIFANIICIFVIFIVAIVYWQGVLGL